MERGNFLTEDTYLGDISDPLTLNRYNYVVSNPLNYIDPSGHNAIGMLQGGMAIGGSLAAADGPLPFGDVAGVVVAGGMYLDEKISQAKAKKKAKDCQDDEKEIKDKGDSQVKLPENTTDAGKKGSKAWNDAKKKIKDGRGKGVNTKTTSQEAAEELLNEARPEFRKETNLLKERKIWL